MDIANNKEVRKIKVGKTPVTTGITSDGKTVIVTLNAENSLVIIDLTTNKVEKIAVGVGPAQTYIESDNKIVYVTNMYDNTVSVINNNTNKVISTVKVGKTPNGISYRQ